jgi:holo-[acyl-carrier protein] synthase
MRVQRDLVRLFFGWWKELSTSLFVDHDDGFRGTCPRCGQFHVVGCPFLVVDLGFAIIIELEHSGGGLNAILAGDTFRLVYRSFELRHRVLSRTKSSLVDNRIASRRIARAADNNQVMAIVGTGVDIIEVERVQRALIRPVTGNRFRQRVFTASEVAYCESRGRPRYQSYAARFAAKEGVMKAMGTGWNRDVGWSEIEVVRSRGRAPHIMLHGKTAEFARRRDITTFYLSLSHTATLAIAYVIAES